jgi:hypothetical protein
LDSMSGQLPSQCPQCGVAYKDFRSGYTWQDAIDLLMTPGRPSDEWVNITTKNVKGRLWALKQLVWGEHLENCVGKTKIEMRKVDEY